MEFTMHCAHCIYAKAYRTANDISLCIGYCSVVCVDVETERKKEKKEKIDTMAVRMHTWFDDDMP